MAEEVEDWVEKEIKGRIGRRSKIDREVLPKGEISSRILRVWSSLHNALVSREISFTYQYVVKIADCSQ